MMVKREIRVASESVVALVVLGGLVSLVCAVIGVPPSREVVLMAIALPVIPHGWASLRLPRHRASTRWVAELVDGVQDPSPKLRPGDLLFDAMLGTVGLLVWASAFAITEQHPATYSEACRSAGGAVVDYQCVTVQGSH